MKGLGRHVGGERRKKGREKEEQPEQGVEG